MLALVYYFFSNVCHYKAVKAHIFTQVRDFSPAISGRKHKMEVFDAKA